MSRLSDTSHTIFTGHLSFLEESLPPTIRDLKQNDPLAEVWVIVPNQLTRLHLRSVLTQGSGIIANVRLMTVTDLMHVLADPITIKEGWRTIGTAVVDPLFAEAILQVKDKLSYLKPVAESSGFRKALLRTRQELILNEIEPDQLYHVALKGLERAAKVKDLILLLTVVKQKLESQNLHDSASLQTLALRALRDNPIQVQPIVLYALYDLAPLTRTVLASAITKTQARAFLPWVENHKGYEFTSSLQKWYVEQHFSTIVSQNSASNYKPIRFVSASKDSSVATEIIRDILHNENISLGEAAVFLPGGSESTLAALESRCSTSKLAPYIYQAKTLGQTSAGRGLYSLAKLLDGQFPIEHVSAYLNAAPFGPAVAGQTSEWIKLSEESFVMSGQNEWRARIERKLAQFERRATSISDNLSEDDDSLSILRRRISNGRELLAFLDRLFKAVAEIRASLNWEIAVSMLWEYYRSEIEMDEEFAGITLQLEQATLLDLANVPYTPAGLVDFVHSTLETPGTRLGKFGANTPLIAPRDQSVGASFAHVFLPGFNEGTLPHMQQQDPLLLDSDRTAINEQLTRQLPLTSDWKDRERFLLEMQLRGATESISIYSTRSDSDGRPQFYSPYVAELLSHQRGEEALSADLEKLFVEDNSCRIVPAHPLQEAELHTAINESEYNRIALGRALKHKHDNMLAHLWKNTKFSRAMSLETERFDRTGFSPFVGVINSAIVKKELSHRFSPEQSFAATGLEEYWKCPFRYVVLREWDAYSPEPLNKLNPVSSRERGLLFHTILQRFHSAQLDKPHTEEYYTWSDLKRIAQIAIAEYARQNPVGPQFTRRKLERDILTSLESYYADFISASGAWRTRHVEVSFGYGDMPIETAAQYTTTDGRFIRFKGRIDRWDSDENGTQIVITDYKSGKGPNKTSRAAQRRLQLGVYHLVAQLNAPDSSVLSRYIFLEREESTELCDDITREHGLETSIQLLEDMRNGLFMPDPDERDTTVCGNCSAKLACGAQRHSDKKLSQHNLPAMKTNRQMTKSHNDVEDSGDE